MGRGGNSASLDAPVPHARARQRIAVPPGIDAPETTVPGVRAAASCLADALRARETVAVFSDYDPDGTCGAAALRLAAGPHARQMHFGFASAADGYGVSRAFVAQAAAAGARTLVTVDCGSNATAEIAFAQQLGMRTIVVDHHEIDPQLPADFHLNPRAVNPATSVSGAVASFKLGLELNELLARDPDYPRRGGWLAGFGARADMMDLTTPENRALMQINTQQSAAPVGVLTLARMMGLRSLTTTNQYKISAVLNLGKRTSRADSADAAAVLFADSERDAAEPAERLLTLHRQCREILRSIRERMETEAVLERRMPYVVFRDPELSDFTGYAGIAAMTLRESTDKPSLVAIVDGAGRAKFSTRAAFAAGDAGLAELRDTLADIAPGCGGHPNAFSGTCDERLLAEVIERCETWAQQRAA
jgi:single-stranded-DNA-specific exonuclease